MCAKIQNFLKEINYSTIGENGSQYSKRHFEPLEVVEAQYIKTPYISTNPLYAALPAPVEEPELAEYATVGMEFNHDEVIKLPDSLQLLIISQVKLLVKIYLPMFLEFSTNIRECLLSSYALRQFKDNDPNLSNITNPIMIYPRIKDSDSGTVGGCNAFGGSGCGKTTALHIVLSFYPQCIKHPLANGGNFPQIVYLKVDCPDGNVSVLYKRIGKQIDNILQNSHLNTAEKMLVGNSRTTNSDRATILEDLINAYGIGLIILDEAQNLRLNDKALIEMLNISNRTQVNFFLISTKYLLPEYELTEDNRKVIRRFGSEIPADRYCQSVDAFYSIIYEISKYQLFQPEVLLIKEEKDSSGNIVLVPNTKHIDALEEIFRFSQGRIEAIVKLWIEMNKAYVEGQRTDIIDKDFVKKVIRTKLRHLSMISDMETNILQKTFQDRLRSAIDGGEDNNEHCEDGIPSDTDRLIDIYCTKASNILTLLNNNLGGNYDEKVIRDAVFQATTRLAEKTNSFSEDDIKTNAIKLLTGSIKKKKKSTSSVPIDKDEFFSSKLRRTTNTDE